MMFDTLALIIFLVVVVVLIGMLAYLFKEIVWVVKGWLK